MMTKRQLVAVATKVRKELESFNGLCDPANKRAKWSMPDDLGGYCMYGAVMVWQALRKCGRRPMLVEGSGHWFTHCDGYLIDVTASQFCERNIEVRLLDEDTQEPVGLLYPTQSYWRPLHRSKTIKGMNHFKKFRNEIESLRRAKRGRS